MKVDVENLIELIEHGYPPIKHSAYWQDLIKLIPKDTPESQWPTGQPTAEEIMQGLQDFCHAENKRGRVPKVSLNDFSAGIHFGIQWLQTSGVREPSKEPRQSYNDLHDERDGLKIELGSVRALASKLNNIIIELNRREKELREVLAELVVRVDRARDILKSRGEWNMLDTTEAKKLLGKTI